MESQDDNVTTIPSTFTPHYGGSTPALEYNTPITVCFRNGEVKDGIVDDFDFNAKHEGNLCEIIGYRVLRLGTLGPAVGIATPHTYTYAAVTDTKPVDRPSQEEQIDMAANTPPHVKPLYKPSEEETEAIIRSTVLGKKAIVINQPDIAITTTTRSTTDDYKTLSDVLERAYQQAAHGKGKERHANNLPFDRQPMQTISQLVGSADGLRYQAIKKIQEAGRMDKDAAVKELLGAINYIAGVIIYIESEK